MDVKSPPNGEYGNKEHLADERKEYNRKSNKYSSTIIAVIAVIMFLGLIIMIATFDEEASNKGDNVKGTQTDDYYSTPSYSAPTPSYSTPSYSDSYQSDIDDMEREMEREMENKMRIQEDKTRKQMDWLEDKMEYEQKYDSSFPVPRPNPY